MMKTTFKTQIRGFGNNTGIEVPESALNELAAGKRPRVKVTVNAYTYQSSVGVMSGMYLVSLPKAHRQASGLEAGDAVTVTLELESKDREVEVPAELMAALEDTKLTQTFQALSYSKRKEFARQVNDAKAEDTKQRRIHKVIDSLK